MSSGISTSTKNSTDPTASFRDLTLSRLVLSGMDSDGAAETFERWDEPIGRNVTGFSTSVMTYDGETVHTSYTVSFSPMFDHEEIVAAAEVALATNGEIELVHDYDESPYFTIYWSEPVA